MHPRVPQKAALEEKAFIESLGSDRYQVLKYLGEGAFAQVYLCLDTVTNKQVAIKQIRDIFDDERSYKLFLREIKMLRFGGLHSDLMSLQNIIPPTESVDTFENINLVFEYIESNLAEVFNSQTYLTLLQIQVIFLQLLCSTAFLHSANILHRDLKPANILLDPKGCSIKVADFGLARASEPMAELKEVTTNTNSNNNTMTDDNINLPSPPTLKRELTNHVVTRWYRAPELLITPLPYGPAVDMWSIGCIFAELLMMQEGGVHYDQRLPLFPGSFSYPYSNDNNENPEDQLKIIFDIMGTPPIEDLKYYVNKPLYPNVFDSLQPRAPEDIKKLFPAATTEAFDLLKRLLEFHPEKRISAVDALKHPFMANFLQELGNPVIYTKISLPLDDMHEKSLLEYYDFEFINTSEKIARQLIMKEVAFYQAADSKMDNDAGTNMSDQADSSNTPDTVSTNNITPETVNTDNINNINNNSDATSIANTQRSRLFSTIDNKDAEPPAKKLKNESERPAFL